MIKIMKVDCIDDSKYNYVSCPTCKSRLCDKPKNEKVSLLQVMSSKHTNNKINHVIIKCKACGNKYLVSTQEDIE